MFDCKVFIFFGTNMLKLFIFKYTTHHIMSKASGVPVPHIVFCHCLKRISFLDNRIGLSQFLIINLHGFIFISLHKSFFLTTFIINISAMTFSSKQKVCKIHHRITNAGKFEINGSCTWLFFVPHDIVCVQISIAQGKVLSLQLFDIVVPIKFYLCLEQWHNKSISIAKIFLFCS